MRCNKGTSVVCTYWDKCQKALFCSNVSRGIRNKLCKKEWVRQAEARKNANR